MNSMISIIKSAHNPKIKHIETLLQKARERKKTQQIVIEGEKEILQAHRANVKVQTLLLSCDHFNEIEKWKTLFPTTELIGVAEEAYKKIAYREGTVPVVALAQMPSFSIHRYLFPENPIILIIEAVEKPGNLGAILRTADAAGIDLVCLCDTQTDLYNPNVIRASIGCVFTLPIWICSSEEAYSLLKEKNVNFWVTALSENSISYTKVDFCQPSAIVVGTESKGVSNFWKNKATANIIIPMRGTIDSMNVSVATAVVVFEAIRQRSLRN
ncbi:MAG: RNA methyltransferase [Cytophagales bacterium]|nr:RNA methyltransferase [Cytophagales bacterium]MDW8384018.1 RNA methyltransferase [Flammeovirgaceae bacterium]